MNDGPIKIKDVYEIVERLEDKFDRRIEQLLDGLQQQRELIDRIDREGAIGTRDTLLELARHGQELDKRLSVLEARPPVTRQDIHDLKNSIGAIQLWQASQQGQEDTQRRVSDRMLAWAALAVALIGFVATIIWLKHG